MVRPRCQEKPGFTPGAGRFYQGLQPRAQRGQEGVAHGWDGEFDSRKTAGRRRSVDGSEPLPRGKCWRRGSWRPPLSLSVL